jgi:hypothetical protein
MLDGRTKYDTDMCESRRCLVGDPNGVRLRKRPFHQRFIAVYRQCRKIGFPLRLAIRSAWHTSRW